MRDTETIEKAAAAIKTEIIKIRHHLHGIPEIGGREIKTAEYIRRILKENNIPYEAVYKTGTKAVIRGGHDGRTVLLRADIDALPLQEESGVAYASEHDGYMHACGHDVHTACLLGAAKILNDMRNELNGNVTLIFQPDEEGDGGALPMINAGVMDNPKVYAAFAMHVEPLEETGKIQVKDGAVMASPDDFEIIIHGTGGHGAYPEKCVNPIEIGSEIVKEYKKRIVNDPEKRVVTICSFNGGTCRNAVPETAVLTGTARSLDKEIRRELKDLLEAIAAETAKKMGGSAEFNFNILFPPVINDKSMNDIVIRSANKLNCVTGITILDKASMAGDDFAYFGEYVPSSYFKLGVGNKDIGAVYPIHSPRFIADDNALYIGSAMMAQTAIEYLK